MCNSLLRRWSQHGFTMVEAIVGVAIIGVSAAVSLGALTKFNSDAAMARNATGAEALLMNQIDLFQSMSPFNPQKTAQVDPCQSPAPSTSPKQIPKDYCNNPPSYDMTAASPGVPVTHTIGYKDPKTGIVSTLSDPWPVYREPSRWTYANTAARTGATGFVYEDIGQLAYQSSDMTYWRLQSTAPAWVQDTNGGIIVRGTMTCTVTDISPTPGAAPFLYQAVFTLGWTYGSRDGGKGGPTWSAARNRWEFQSSMSVIRASDI
jgi:prepilin-type N-terminal cleavage/methylation domain-containing protein